MLAEDVEVDTFWHCDAADKEQGDNGCVAHLIDSCWRRLVASCDVSNNEVTYARYFSFYTALVHVSWSACVHFDFIELWSVTSYLACLLTYGSSAHILYDLSDLCCVTGSKSYLLVVLVHAYILNQMTYTV